MFCSDRKECVIPDECFLFGFGLSTLSSAKEGADVGTAVQKILYYAAGEAGLISPTRKLKGSDFIPSLSLSSVPLNI